MKQEERDREQIELLYRQHGAALVLYATTIVGDRSSAQDAVHRVFLRLVESASQRNAEDKKAFLFACVRNDALNQVRRQRRDVVLDPDALWLTSPVADPIAESSLQKSLTHLPNQQREVLVLHIWGELTFAQIGNLLNISSNTVASPYRYALVALRSLMLSKEKFHANSG